jgi:hypothetical protein
MEPMEYMTFAKEFHDVLQSNGRSTRILCRE